MPHLSVQFERLSTPGATAESLAARVEADLAGASVAGGLLLANAAAGRDAMETGTCLGGRWPSAELLGTSFEGVLAGGQVWQNEPAVCLLAWSGGVEAPLPMLLEIEASQVDVLAAEILETLERPRLCDSDMIFVFPDSLASAGLESWLVDLRAALGGGVIAGAAASGIEGAPALSWSDEVSEPGRTIMLVVAGPEAPSPISQTPRRHVARSRASRLASPWLEITAARSRWIDCLDEEPALVWVRRQLGLEESDPIEPLLDRLLVRLRRRSEASLDREAVAPGGADPGSEESEPIDEERYVVGLDPERGAFSLPIEVARGDEVALALPDAEIARRELAGSVEGLGSSPWLLQFSCRARDAALHGDVDLEAAFVRHCASDSEAIGTLSSFQVGPRGGPGSDPGVHVHATILAALGDLP